MSRILDSSKDGELFARDEPGPAMDPAAVELTYDSIEIFATNPELRTTIQHFYFWDGMWRYTLLGMGLRLMGFDIRCLNPYGERYEIATELLITEGKYSVFDYYAIEELARHADDPEHLREMFDEYVAFPLRIPEELRTKKATSWA